MLVPTVGAAQTRLWQYRSPYRCSQPYTIIGDVSRFIIIKQYCAGYDYKEFAYS